MSKLKNKNQIIIINSFKGGCGKTALSLSLAITALMKKQEVKKFEYVHYIDVDFTGTGSKYKLFGNTENIKYVSYEEPDFEAKNDLQIGGNMLFAYLIDPKTRQVQEKGIDDVVINKEIKENGYIVQLVEYMKSKIIETSKQQNEEQIDEGDEKGNLFIIDCTPGYQSIEKKLFNELFEECMKIALIKMYFVTSISHAHFKKTIDNLNDIYVSNKEKYIQEMQHIIVNDSYNMYEHLKPEIEKMYIIKENNIENGIPTFVTGDDKKKLGDIFSVFKDSENYSCNNSTYQNLANKSLFVGYNEDMAKGEIIALRETISGELDVYKNDELYKFIIDGEKYNG